MSLADPIDETYRPICADCAHINQGSCERPVGRHFHSGSNSYRSRLHVLAAQERVRDKTLTGRVCCGPEGRYFEPRGSLDPILPVDRVQDTIADSDGDDGA